MQGQLEARTTRRLSPGRFYPLGATPEADGVNFALYSQHATEVFLLLFDQPVGEPTDVIPLAVCTRFVWHVFVHGLRPGQLYAYRVGGPFDPGRGLRFCDSKLLIDPYAKALTGKLHNRDNLLLAYDPMSPQRDLSRDLRDSAQVVPRCIVVDDQFDWKGDVPPDLPLEDLYLYEVHVKGFTAHPSSGAFHRGTYLGFIERIPHLRQLGINAVELLPLHEIYVEDGLLEKGLSNYWGYNTVAFFAPESSYGTGSAPGCQVAEFKTMVRELHRAGIEVLLDVVYNHTGEGNELGPTFSFKGIDNPTYYALTGPPAEPRRYYMNYTGCGNSLNLAHPHVIRLVMDSLRYWVQVMHVDGFRFDLASVLGREEGSFQTCASFFDAVSQDPVLCRIKLIAEPWDIGTYQVGNFPVDWSEWNGKFRDCMRRFGKGDGGIIPELGWRLTGSADLYGDDGRSPYNSINFITCHDGFTLRDLATYNHKHNLANLENNRDGSDDNHSWNCGAEGETGDDGINRLRRQLCKNQIAYLLLSAGTPMLLGGDEFLRSQRGNNNAYCQDNEINWFDWHEAERNRDFCEFVRKAIAFNRRHRVFRRRKFLTGGDTDRDLVPDIAWFGPDLGPPAWGDPNLRLLCYQLDTSEDAREGVAGSSTAASSSAARPADGDHDAHSGHPSDGHGYRLFVILNADCRMQRVLLPLLASGRGWHRVLDTSLEAGEDFAEPGAEVRIEPADHYLVNGRSTVVLIEE